MGEQTELVRTNLSDIQTWDLDRDIVIKAVDEIRRRMTVNFKSQEYYDNKDLRRAIEEVLADPNFGHYYQTQEDLRKLREESPKELELFESVDTEEALQKLVTKYKDNPVYREYKILSEKEIRAILRLNAKMTSARVLPIAAAYARLAKIVFPEIAGTKDSGSTSRVEK